MLKAIEQALIWWARMAFRAAPAVLLVTGALLIAAGYATVRYLKVNTDTSAMLDPALPFQQRAAALRAEFPQIKSDLLVIVEAPTADEADSAASALYDRLKKRDDVIEDAFATAQDPFFMRNGLLFLSEEDLDARLTQLTKASGLIEKLIASPTADTLFTTLADNDALAEAANAKASQSDDSLLGTPDLAGDSLNKIYRELAAVAQSSLDATTRPFSWMGAIDPDTTAPPSAYHRLIYVTPKLDYTRLQPAKATLRTLRQEIDSLTPTFHGRIDFYITGDPALRAEELESVSSGIGLSLGMSLILVALLLYFAFRSFFMAGLTLVALIITLILTTGFAAITIGELNLVSVAFTVLLVGLGLDFAIHLLLHVQERRDDGQEIVRALNGAMHEVGPALALAAPTTALAFLSFMPTRFDGIAQLGIIAGVGVLIAFAVSVTFLPAVLAFAPSSRKRQPSGAIRKVFALIERFAKPVTMLTVIAGIGALTLLPQARFEADPMALRNPDSPSVQGFQRLFEDDNTVPYRLTRMVLDLSAAEETAAAAKQLPTVGSVRSLADFNPKNQDEKLELIDIAAGSLVFAFATPPGERPAISNPGIGLEALQIQLADRTGPAGDLAALLATLRQEEHRAAYQRLEEQIFAYWPQLVERLSLQLEADYVSLDDLPASLKQRYLSANGVYRVDILPAEDIRDRQALNRFTKSVEALFPDIGGGALQTQKAGGVIAQAMAQATSIAVIVIFVFLWFLVRRLSTVALMLTPLILAASLTIGTSVLINLPFNYANVIVLPLLIGIGVDSAIHLVLRRQQIREGDHIYGTSTPRAVLFSSLTTVASFGSLTLSSHRGTASMGELLCIAIAFTLICTLIVLPFAFSISERTPNTPSDPVT